MDKEHYEKVGYVDAGYISPELGSGDTYPEYIKKNVEECVAQIQSHQNRTSVTFGFMTDLHYSHTYNHNIRMQRNMNAYKEIAKRAFVDRLILGGDYANDGVKSYKVNSYRELRAHLDGIAYFPVNGNHDDNSIWDESCIKSEVSTQHVTTEELYQLFYNHLPARGAIFDKHNPGLYYYLDDKVNRIRYIFVDTNDIPIRFDEKGKFLYTKQHTFAVSQRQLDWLVGEALKFEEDRWDVVMVMHNALAPSRENEEDKEEEKYLGILNCLIAAYKNGQDVQRDFYEGDFALHLQTDFSNGNRGKLIGVFAGHYHKDIMEYSESGVPYIFIGNVIFYNQGMPRTDGDKSELLFDIVTIDREKHIIYLTRVGAGESRSVQY